MTLLRRVPSRYFLAPINTGFAVRGAPTDRLVAFHRNRSGHGIGISYVGNVAVGTQYATNERTLVFSEERVEWERLVRTIHAAGSWAGVQVACRASTEAASRQWRSADLAELRWAFERIATDELDAIVGLFGSSARFASDAGFDVIQLHAAHGYLLSQALNPWLNIRRDEYGARPMLLLERVIEAVREAAPHCALDVRMSLSDGVATEEEEWGIREQQIASVVEMGVDMVSLSSGMYEISRHLIYPSRAQGLAAYLPYGLYLAGRHVRMAWNVAGNVWQLPEAPEVLPENLSFSIGRPLIADPLFIEKELRGERSSIRACDFNGACHYYTRGEPHLVCPVSEDLRPGW